MDKQEKGNQDNISKYLLILVGIVALVAVVMLFMNNGNGNANTSVNQNTAVVSEQTDLAGQAVETIKYAKKLKTKNPPKSSGADLSKEELKELCKELDQENENNNDVKDNLGSTNDENIDPTQTLNPSLLKINPTGFVNPACTGKKEITVSKTLLNPSLGSDNNWNFRSIVDLTSNAGVIVDVKASFMPSHIAPSVTPKQNTEKKYFDYKLKSPFKGAFNTKSLSYEINIAEKVNNQYQCEGKCVVRLHIKTACGDFYSYEYNLDGKLKQTEKAKPETTTVAVGTEFVCTDSDSGNDKYKLGTVTVMSSTKTKKLLEMPDSCTTDGSLSEMYCNKKGQLDTVNINCFGDCSAGVCPKPVEKITVKYADPNYKAAETFCKQYQYHKNPCEVNGGLGTDATPILNKNYPNAPKLVSTKDNGQNGYKFACVSFQEYYDGDISWCVGAYSVYNYYSNTGKIEYLFTEADFDTTDKFPPNGASACYDTKDKSSFTQKVLDCTLNGGIQFLNENLIKSKVDSYNKK